MLRAAWGKFNAHVGTHHHLAHHCADVAACFEVISRLPVIRNRLSCALDRQISDLELNRVTALVFLHDAGKLHPGFQMRGWPDETWGGQPHGHVREGLELFLAGNGGDCLPMALDLHLVTLGDWGVSEALLQAVVSHHGRPAPNEMFSVADTKATWRARGPYDPVKAAREMGALLPQWFPDAFEPGGTQLPEPAPAFEHLICGLVTLADWIGSDVDWFAHRAVLDADYMVHARAQAERACRAIGVDATLQRASRTRPVSFQDLTGFVEPNAQQTLVGATDFDAQIIILEAETGSGKTEAALWHYMRLFEAGRVDGLYFAVPTRSAAVQLHARVVKAAERVFGNASPQPVLAVPGYIRAGELEGQPLPHWRVLWDDEAAADASKLKARWAAEHSKRYLAAQIAVGTVDQAMLGALTVKHAHLRAASLSRSLLVIDEVHASDAYMTRVQKRLLDSHVAVGGYAMLMSATLGSSARAQWLGHAEPSCDDVIAIPYPAVWTSKDSAPRSPEEAPAKSKRVAMEEIATMAAEVTAERALTAARQGARVLVIRNTVKRAIETLVAVEAMMSRDDTCLLFQVNGVATLHHSRFAPSDRKCLDQAVELALTTSKDRIPAGRIVIGTQTLEQSLDIDADLLLTDLCPIDVLLQRIGRLHRHALARPQGFDEPRCGVMVPEGGLLPLLAPAFENGLGAWKTRAGTLQGVYRDVSILELTRRLLAEHPAWVIPNMNRLLVESAVHPERISALNEQMGAQWTRYHQDVVGSELANMAAAQGILLDRNKPFDQTKFPDGAEEKIRTRLGDDSIRVTLAEPHPLGPFGEAISEAVLPARWLRDSTVDGDGAEHCTNEDRLLFNLNGQTFKYDRFGLAPEESADAGTESTKGSPDPVRDD